MKAQPVAIPHWLPCLIGCAIHGTWQKVSMRERERERMKSAEMEHAATPRFPKDSPNPPSTLPCSPNRGHYQVPYSLAIRSSLPAVASSPMLIGT